MASRPRTQRRQKKYSDKLAEKLLEAFALQDKGLAEFVDNEDKFPGSNIVWRWMADEDGFRDKVVLARERQLERMMYGSLDELANCETSGALPGDGAANVAKHKAVADLSMKLASKMVPKVYCERLAVDLDGKVKGAITLNVDSDDLETPTDGASATPASK